MVDAITANASSISRNLSEAFLDEAKRKMFNKPYSFLDEMKNKFNLQTDTCSSCNQSQLQLVADLDVFAKRALDRWEISTAEEVFRYILHILSVIPNAPEIEIIETLACVGSCCEFSGRLEEAMSCYKEALQLKAHQRLQDEPQRMKLALANIFHAIGLIHSKILMEDYTNGRSIRQEVTVTVATKAIRSFSLSLNLRKECLGEENLLVASSQHNIAAILTRTGNVSTALEYYKASLAVRRSVLGKGHPEVASSLRHMAMTYRAMGRHQEAANALTQALAILKEIPHEGSLAELLIELSHVKHSLSSSVRI